MLDRIRCLACSLYARLGVATGSHFFGVAVALSIGLGLAVEAGASLRHVMFCFVDHWEPSWSGHGSVQAWVEDYLALAQNHADADGRHPMHTYHLLWNKSWAQETSTNAQGCLRALNEVTYKGCGEVELHVHMGVPDERTRTEQEAIDEFMYLTNRARDVFPRYGAMITSEPSPQVTFNFIHGMWALDNSRLDTWTNPNDPHRAWCGVNEEIRLLAEQGCYADFTFPAWGPMEPNVKDSIFYVQDDPEPASYQNPNNIRMVAVGSQPYGQLMIIEGPSCNVNIGTCAGVYDDPATLGRMNEWVAHNVHVVGQDDWVFVKVYTHGCAGHDQDYDSWWETFFGQTMEDFYTAIEAVYDDGVNWKLHYVSAREMYNIIKAAEAGMTGEPGQYRNFVIPPPANTRILAGNEYRMLSYNGGVTLEVLDEGSQVEFSLLEFTPSDPVLERNEGEGWVVSDAQIGPGEFGELHFVDVTPSRWYSTALPILRLDVVNPLWGEVLVDPNLPGYEPGVVVTLTAIPFEGRCFTHWTIFDPNCPDDANYASIDTNLAIAIVMDNDRDVTAHFRCGSSVGGFLPITLGALGAFLAATRLRGFAARGCSSQS